MAHLNGRSGLTGIKEADQSICSILEDWLFLVREDAGALANSAVPGFDVDVWSRPGAIKNLKGKKVILVFSQFGEERKDEFEILGAVRQAEPAALRVWKPYGLGDETTPTLRALSERYSLPETLFWDKPWLSPPPPIGEPRKVGWACTDMGNAERMADRFGSILRYCRPWKKWITWTGQRWEQDDTGRVEIAGQKNHTGMIYRRELPLRL